MDFLKDDVSVDTNTIEHNDYEQDPHEATRAKQLYLESKREINHVNKQLEKDLTEKLGEVFLSCRDHVIPRSRREPRMQDTLTATSRSLPGTFRMVERTHRRQQFVGAPQQPKPTTTTTQLPVVVNPSSVSNVNLLTLTGLSSTNSMTVVTAPKPPSTARGTHRTNAQDDVSNWQRGAHEEKKHFESMYVWAQLTLSQAEEVSRDQMMPNAYQTAVAVQVIDTLAHTVLKNYSDVLVKAMTWIKKAVYLHPESLPTPASTVNTVSDGTPYRQSQTYFQCLRDMDTTLRKTSAKLDYQTKAARLGRAFFTRYNDHSLNQVLSRCFYVWKNYQVHKQSRNEHLRQVWLQIRDRQRLRVAFNVFRALLDAKRTLAERSQRSHLTATQAEQLMQEMEALKFMSREGETNSALEVARTHQELADLRWNFANLEKQLSRQKEEQKNIKETLEAVCTAWSQAATTAVGTVTFGVAPDPFIDTVVDDIAMLIKLEEKSLKLKANGDRIVNVETVNAMEKADVQAKECVEHMLITWVNLHLRQARYPHVFHHVSDLLDGSAYLALINTLGLCTPQQQSEVDTLLPGPQLHALLSQLFLSFGQFPLLTPLLLHHPMFWQVFSPETILLPKEHTSFLSWHWWLVATLFVCKAILGTRGTLRPLYGFVPEPGPDYQPSLFDTYPHITRKLLTFSPGSAPSVRRKSMSTKPPIPRMASVVASVNRVKSRSRSMRKSRSNSITTVTPLTPQSNDGFELETMPSIATEPSSCTQATVSQFVSNVEAGLRSRQLSVAAARVLVATVLGTAGPGMWITDATLQMMGTPTWAPQEGPTGALEPFAGL